MDEKPTKSDNLPTEQRKALVIKLYEKYFGNIRKTCRNAQINRDTFYEWKASDSEFAKKIAGIQFGEDLLDLAESKAIQMIKGFEYEEKHTIETAKGIITKKIKKRVLPSERLIEFVLKTRGKDRGYSDKEQEGGDKNMGDIDKREKILDEMLKKIEQNKSDE